MSVEDHPTQRIQAQPERSAHAPDATTTAMPGPLNLAGDNGTDTTGVLPLDELFETEPAASSPPAASPAAAPPATAQAPTWTAMPVVSVSSDPVGPHRDPATSAPAGPALGGRIRDDASAAWDATVRRTRAWLGRDDNALTLLTAVVAVILIVAVTGLSG